MSTPEIQVTAKDLRVSSKKVGFTASTSSREAGGMAILDPLAEEARIEELRAIRAEDSRKSMEAARKAKEAEIAKAREFRMEETRLARVAREGADRRKDKNFSFATEEGLNLMKTWIKLEWDGMGSRSPSWRTAPHLW